ncbi:MAG: PilC/PilY family type IV pilus protein [Proteobacteria bacterium]|nr:PilC/PilY family type IV pilus protein [Pseudomonadota bacterium]
MDTRTGKLASSGKRTLRRAAILSLASAAAMAAALFVANDQPLGYIAPPALSGKNFSKGNVVAYTPWFEDGSFRGDLMALPVGTSGAVDFLTPQWRAATVLDTQDFLSGRRIVTTDGLGAGIPFQFAALTPAQQSQISSASLLNYVRGDRTKEGNGYRVRNSVLGDIIHSTPVYVGKPSAGFTDAAYLSFAIANAGRSPRVYVGANDGMLHAFDAASGAEVFAYVPSMVMGNLPKLAAQPYKHQYSVDGFLTSEDAQFGGSWHTVLVGGLGAGGKGYFALDVSSADAATEGIAAGKILWEFHSGSADAGNLGLGYSRPSIVKLNNDQWAAVVANGYLSATGVASLYLLDVQTGAVIREIIVPDLAANGLSSPILIDADADGLVDVAYAGDLNGNLWRFNLKSTSPAAWSVAYEGAPLFRTALNGGVRQPITTAPEVGRHPLGGVMVYVATGRLFTAIDTVDKTTQAVFGIWDNDWAAASVPIGIAQLRPQQLKSATHFSGASVRVATAGKPNWTVQRGWMTPIEIADATVLDQGERVIQDISLRDNRISFVSVNPSIPTGDNWFIQLNALTGGAPTKTIIDVNADFVLDIQDNVDGNGDGLVADIPEDRAVGQYQNFGLASRPVVGVLGAGKDAALINHLVAISPATLAVGPDPGLLGGHFDLDTSHLTYPFNGGVTDGHVHQWDDKHNLTTIDYFALPDGNGSPLHEINDSANAVSPSEVFILTVANQNLSPGGVLEINGASMGVGVYGELMERYLSGTLLPGESFPRYKLDAPTAAEASAGIQRLTSLKLSFDAFAILAGDLIPTNTNAVKANAPGALGEYRNGALMIQALNASGVSGGFVFNAATDEYVAANTAVKATLGYATKGMLWETTVFWHWNGPDYGEAGYAKRFDSCVTQGLGGCTKASTKDEEKKAKKKKKKRKKDDDDKDAEVKPLPEPAEVLVATDPGHAVTNTTVGGSTEDTGRLFWRELIPEE